ncbi:MAG: phosphotransferase [Chloroflexota bacterium]
MDQQIIARYNDSILEQARQRYGISSEHVSLLDSVENFVYEFERDNTGYILRIGHTFRKSEALIRGEVDWINYLASNGVSVARAIPSVDGNLVEVIEDGYGGQFLATAFIRAAGLPPWQAGWTSERFERYGQLIGEMHTLAVTYQPQAGWQRPAWDDASLKFIELYLPAEEVHSHQAYQSVIEHIYSLPKDKNSYGLIHQDAHQNNFFMDADGKLTLFDFDDCAYSWFINDIAIVLFYISMDAEELGFPSAAAFTQQFMTHFLRGYRQAYTLDSSWLKEMPAFLKLRELELYAVVHRDFDIHAVEHWSLESFKRIAGFDPTSGNDMWIANFMRNRKMNIEQGLPFIDFDFESLGRS